jgi:hypothetical protein
MPLIDTDTPVNNERPGISFEKIVAALQARLDPAAIVSHNETLVDRLMQRRQFDVVIRGKFAGQPMLGVIECKDLAQKVGTPEVDAFHTKASDINANFKILMSRRGFTKPALDKCRHYGIRTLSLIDRDPSNQAFRLGTTWFASLSRWSQIAVTLHHVPESPSTLLSYKAGDLVIEGKRVIDWFHNYLSELSGAEVELGWSSPIRIDFREPRVVHCSDDLTCECIGLSFSAERVCEELEYFVSIGGEGFFDWQETEIIFAPESTFRTKDVPTDFSLWSPRKSVPESTPGFIVLSIEVSDVLDRIEDAIDLMML